MTNLMIAMHSDKPPQACTQTSGGTMEGNVVVGSLKLTIPKYADCYNLHCLQITFFCLFITFSHSLRWASRATSTCQIWHSLEPLPFHQHCHFLSSATWQLVPSLLCSAETNTFCLADLLFHKIIISTLRWDRFVEPYTAWQLTRVLQLWYCCIPNIQ